MRLNFGSNLFNGSASAAYLFIGAFAWFTHDWRIHAGALTVIFIFSALSWRSCLQRYHWMADTPTSRIASAAQGLVELSGTANVPLGAHPIGFRSSPPCVWYRYTVSRHHDNSIEVIDRGESDDTFMLTDDSGECVIDPEKAEVITDTSKSWNDGHYHITVDYIAPGTEIYALGLLDTITATQISRHRDADVRAQLTDWKQDPDSLYEQFDQNNDGMISAEEWQQTRKAAAKAVDENHREARLRPDINILKHPGDHRPYLLSNRPHDRLMLRYQIWTWVHFSALAVTSVTVLLWVTRGVNPLQ